MAPRQRRRRSRCRRLTLAAVARGAAPGCSCRPDHVRRRPQARAAAVSGCRANRVRVGGAGRRQLGHLRESHRPWDEAPSAHGERRRSTGRRCGLRTEDRSRSSGRAAGRPAKDRTSARTPSTRCPRSGGRSASSSTSWPRHCRHPRSHGLPMEPGWRWPRHPKAVLRASCASISPLSRRRLSRFLLRSPRATSRPRSRRTGALWRSSEGRRGIPAASSVAGTCGSSPWQGGTPCSSPLNVTTGAANRPGPHAATGSSSRPETRLWPRSIFRVARSGGAPTLIEGVGENVAFPTAQAGATRFLAARSACADRDLENRGAQGAAGEPQSAAADLLESGRLPTPVFARRPEDRVHVHTQRERERLGGRSGWPQTRSS